MVKANRKVYKLLDYLHVTAFSTKADPQNHTSNRKMMSRGQRRRRATVIHWPIYEAMRASVAKNWTTISQPKNYYTDIIICIILYLANDKITFLSLLWYNKIFYLVIASLLCTGIHFPKSSDIHQTMYHTDSQDAESCENKTPIVPCFRKATQCLPMTEASKDWQRTSKVGVPIWNW